MADVWLLKNLLGTLLLPPANALLLLALAGFFRKRRWSFGLAVFAGVLMLAQCLPTVSSALMATLEDRAGTVLTDAKDAQAIVILSSGLRRDADEYGGDTVTERSLVRLRYGATLARRHQLPVLVTGGQPPTAHRAEADAIGDVLENEFGVAVRWRETGSKDTADNATLSAQILRAAGIRRIILVTQAFHMPRALRLFEDAGFDVLPAPTDFKSHGEDTLTPADWVPQAYALHNSYYALHEWLGIAWFELVKVFRPAP